MVIIRISRGGAGGGCGEANTISALGCGLGLTATVDKVGIDLRVRSLAAGAGISIGEAADLITITNTGGCGCGESNTISSVGGGTSPLVACPSKVGVDLRTKTLNVSTDLSKTDAANLITLGLQNLPVLGTLPASPRPTCITNAEIIAAAGIPYSKLTFANNIVAGDIAACAVGSSELANCAVDIAAIQDNAVTLAKMAGGVDGNLITYDACGNPAAVATGTACQVLTSNGAGAAPTFQAGGGGGGGVEFAVKQCDESITCDTTLSTDTTLQFCAAANRTYWVTAYLWLETGSTPDFKYAWVFPCGADTEHISAYWNATTEAGGKSACLTNIVLTPNANPQLVADIIKIDTGACGGLVALQWAQNTSSACTTVLAAGSAINWAGT